MYCLYCEKWLNGPTQWTDHEIGKPHRKAFRKKQTELQLGAEATSTAGRPIKDVPEGFGKRPQEPSIPHRSSITKHPSKSAEEEDEKDERATSIPAASRGHSSSAGYDMFHMEPPLLDNIPPQAYYAWYRDPVTGGTMPGLIVPEDMLSQFHHGSQYQ
jgi:hypothetical protein